MLMFHYVLLISVFSSSAIATGPLMHNSGAVRQPLLRSKVDRLRRGVWARFEIIEGTQPTWTKCKYLDDLIQFNIGDQGGVGRLNTLRIQRFMDSGTYKVYPAKADVTAPLQENVPIDQWPEYLVGMWFRLPKILGRVSDSVIRNLDSILYTLYSICQAQRPTKRR